MRRFFLTLFLLVSLTALGAGAFGLWWVNQPLKLPAPNVDLSMEAGSTPRAIAQAVAETGTAVEPQLLYWWFRFSGQDRQIRAGSYELERGITPRTLLNVLVRGEEATRSLVLVEGWNIRQVRAALAKADQLKPETVGLSDQALMEKLGRSGQHPEGRFFPDTYTRSGLPPTPIAMPGKAALLAAVQPAEGKSLYFVSRGDGTSQFSSSLEEHNAAVNRYQRNRQ